MCIIDKCILNFDKFDFTLNLIKTSYYLVIIFSLFYFRFNK